MDRPRETPPEFRICATCRHLEVLEQGREFASIVDTEYAVFRCARLGTVTREDYLMAPVPTELPAERPPACPFWEGHELPGWPRR